MQNKKRPVPEIRYLPDRNKKKKDLLFLEDPSLPSSEFNSELDYNDTSSEEYYHDEDANLDFCFLCNADEGKLIMCDNCCRAFHLKCLSFKEIPLGLWECPYCLESAKSSCTKCKETFPKEQIPSAKVICSSCCRYSHFKCIDVPVQLLIDSPLNRDFFCNSEMLKYLEGQKHGLFYGGRVINNYREIQVSTENQMNVSQLFYFCRKCLEQTKVTKILDHSKYIIDEFERTFYLVKVDKFSYLHIYWLEEDIVDSIASKKLKRYKEHSSIENQLEMEYSYESHPLEGITFKIERILACKKPIKYSNEKYVDLESIIYPKAGDSEDNLKRVENFKYGAKDNFWFFVKWEGLHYDECSWEEEMIVKFFKSAIHKYISINIKDEISRKNDKHNYNRGKKLEKNVWKPPEGLELHDFQETGVNWLYKSWKDKRDVILADEMGLGKTIQTLSYLGKLHKEQNLDGPFLVVAPSSTILNWLKEFNTWLPEFNVLAYVGNQDSRRRLRQWEFYYQSKKPKFNALITSYEFIRVDSKRLKVFEWESIIVDEAHRLKNNESKFFKECSQFVGNHKILLTGTPLQNNIGELLNLHEFISPHETRHLKNLESLKVLLDPPSNTTHITEIAKKNAIQQLQEVLSPRVLRRTKEEVNIQLPELDEIVIRLHLRPAQIFLYKNVLYKNYENLKIKTSSKVSLHNILVNLRLVCNHPLLLTNKRDLPYIRDPDEFRTEYIESSNKIKFMEKLLEKLLQKGHKILIFSQFTTMLDVLEKLMEFKRWEFERLDGKTGIIERQKRIDSFNEDTSKAKIFLLSTRAGGIGINLTAADSLVFTDNDFNPFRDIQAISRAHRIGQTRKVQVLRLVSKMTVEEKIIDIGTKKLLMEEILINPISKFSKEDLDQMLRHGSFEMFKQNFEPPDEDFTDDQIDALVSRDPERIKNLNINNDLSATYLSGYKFQRFTFQSLFGQKQKDVEPTQEEKDKSKYWENVLGEDVSKERVNEENEFGKGKRVKKQITNLSDEEDSSDNDESDFGKQGANINQEQDIEKSLKIKALKSKVNDFFAKVLNDNQIAFANFSEEYRLNTLVCNFNEIHRNEFLLFVLKYGFAFKNLEEFWRKYFI